MKNLTKAKKPLAITLVLILILGLSACAALQTYFKQLKGELLGNDYQITEYDNFGNITLRVSGDKITMNAETDSNGEPTSYVNILVDGYEWQHVGSTLVFMQNGVDMITDFEIPDEISANNSASTGLMTIDRRINHYKNQFGQGQVVLVSTQNGTPIGLFRGKKCNVTIPEDLPKMTLINIDGKFVYIHRADVDVIPVGLFDN